MYKPLAKYYDVLQAEIEYTTWLNLVNDNCTKEDEIFEVGSGTGTLATKLIEEGYNVNVSDYSPEMVAAANKKGLNAQVVDITNYSSQTKYKNIISFMDVINYLTAESDLIKAFSTIEQLLTKDGVFIFDIQHQENIEYFDEYHEEIALHDTTLIWDSKYLGENLVMHELDFGDFGKETQYQRFHEVVYYLKQLEPFFKKVEVLQDDYRVYFICRKD